MEDTVSFLWRLEWKFLLGDFSVDPHCCLAFNLTPLDSDLPGSPVHRFTWDLRSITEGWMKEMVHELDFHREVRQKFSGTFFLEHFIFYVWICLEGLCLYVCIGVNPWCENQSFPCYQEVENLREVPALPCYNGSLLIAWLGTGSPRTQRCWSERSGAQRSRRPEPIAPFYNHFYISDQNSAYVVYIGDHILLILGIIKSH